MTEAAFQAVNARDFTPFEQISTDDVAFDFPGVGRKPARERFYS